MMPLVLANVGEPQIVKRIGGNPETKRHLEDLGFTVGGEVCIVSTLGGNVIVKVKESRVAVSDELAMGVIKAAREENIPLPEGLAVAGFTGSEAAAVITPALTTMEHPLERLGAVAARRLIELIEDSALYQVETHEIVLKSKLKIRRSCGNRKEIYELFE